MQNAYIWIISKCVLLKCIHSTSEQESPVLTIQSWQKVWPSVFSVCSARQTACVWSHRRHRSALHAVELQSSWVWQHAIHRLALDHCCTCTTSSSTTFYTSYASIITASTINNNKKETTTTTRTTTTNILLPFLKLFWLHHIHLWVKPPQKKTPFLLGIAQIGGTHLPKLTLTLYICGAKTKIKKLPKLHAREEVNLAIPKRKCFFFFLGSLTKVKKRNWNHAYWSCSDRARRQIPHSLGSGVLQFPKICAFGLKNRLFLQKFT